MKRVERSFKNFFNGFGYPRFKEEIDTTVSHIHHQVSKWKMENSVLSKIGNIKIILHREIEGKIKTCTIKKDIDQWYVPFQSKSTYDNSC